MHHIVEPTRQVPVIAEADVCVLGGSCTGVFAAIRAARLGAKVVLIEKAGCFGGVATLSLVNVWHSPLDTIYERQIIGGLTLEIMERLKKRNAVVTREKNPSWAWCFNSQELQIELDEMVCQARMCAMLHTSFVAPHLDSSGKLDAVIVENKSGRGAVRAGVFIDATGDGDLCHRMGLPTYVGEEFQPATTCATISGWGSLDRQDVWELIRQHGPEFNLPPGFAWTAPVPGSDVVMLAGTRVYGANCAEAESLTAGEIDGRRQVRAIMDLLRKYAPQTRLALQALPSRIGIRETRHVRCKYQLTGPDVLYGVRFPDAIANGSYRVDVHHQSKPGITFKYLDGTQQWLCPGHATEHSRWREPVAKDPTFYQIPYRSMVPGVPNVLIAGRMIDADSQAHAGIRVMVNMNQTGEAAGVAAVQALNAQQNVNEIDTEKLRAALETGGSVII